MSRYRLETTSDARDRKTMGHAFKVFTNNPFKYFDPFDNPSQPVIEQQRFQNWKDCTIYERVAIHRRSRRLLSCLPYVLFQDTKQFYWVKRLVFVYEKLHSLLCQILFWVKINQIDYKSKDQNLEKSTWDFILFWKIPKTLVTLSKSGHITRWARRTVILKISS